MDLFEYLQDYEVWVCTQCGFAIKPSHLKGHLLTRHADHPHLDCKRKVQLIVTELMQKPLADFEQTPFLSPAPGLPALPFLPIHNGLACIQCTYVARSERTINNHCQTKHIFGKRQRGRQPKTLIAVSPRWKPVACQRFFSNGIGSGFFAVVSPTQLKEEEERERRKVAHALSEEDFVKAQVNSVLEEVQQEIEGSANIIMDNAAETEVSPWLEMTRWPRYLHGYSFDDIAPLGSRADPVTEPLLAEFSRSLNRVVEQSHSSICSDKVNVFDQVKINSFVQRKSAWDRPLMIKLKKSTYREYILIWERLLCFACRTIQPTQSITLSHKLSTAQVARLDQMIGYGEELLALKRGEKVSVESNREGGAGLCHEIETQLDRACLMFCISLLDHTLKGDLFESTIVGFLAVLGVDPQKKIFKDAYSYTTHLSAFIKIAQMLVVQRAVVMAEDGEIEHPADVLDEMRERFMIHGSRSPFNWALRLRAYGKRIRNTTTSLGYIYWSDDHEKLTYKSLEMTMTGFKAFVCTELELAQSQLESLFLLHQDESREMIVPTFELRDVKDDPTKNAKGWNFLKDPRNERVLPDGQRWLLDRILENDWLRAEFIEVRQNDSKVIWKSAAVKSYISQIDSFLERLVLLVHLTAGQPARGTEIFSLRHCNTVHGHQRSIFIEDGLVSTVTAYHKGYNIVGSTKIIHRYLPKEVSELVVYYLWLIHPFWCKLELLALNKTESSSPFLWPKGKGSWDSPRLSTVLKREAEAHLNTSMNITLYRHVAIAISRVHLKCGGFKRDYGLDDTKVSNQASHTSWIAGTIYARGLEEAPGHVEARRTEYRAISREWHRFLGFRVYLPARKRPLSELVNHESQRRRTTKTQRLDTEYGQESKVQLSPLSWK